MQAHAETAVTDATVTRPRPWADSIMGVALFREESPEGFGVFDRGLSRSGGERGGKGAS